METYLRSIGDSCKEKTQVPYGFYFIDKRVVDLIQAMKRNPEIAKMATIAACSILLQHQGNGYALNPTLFVHLAASDPQVAITLAFHAIKNIEHMHQQQLLEIFNHPFYKWRQPYILRELSIALKDRLPIENKWNKEHIKQIDDACTKAGEQWDQTAYEEFSNKDWVQAQKVYDKIVPIVTMYTTLRSQEG